MLIHLPFRRTIIIVQYNDTTYSKFHIVSSHSQVDYVTSESGEESGPERDELLRPKQRAARNAGNPGAAAAEPLSGALEEVEEPLANDELRGVEDEAALRPLCLDSDEEQIEAAVEADLLGVENPDEKSKAELMGMRKRLGITLIVRVSV